MGNVIRASSLISGALLTAHFGTTLSHASPAAFDPDRGGWLQGDLHAHSNYGDGDSTVADVLKDAEERGLDFFALSEHDNKSMQGNITHWFDPGFMSQKMVLLHAAEWTTTQGHANLLADAPFNYQDFWQANLNFDSKAMFDAAEREDVLVSVNHPAAGRRSAWLYPLDERIGAMEVWNSNYRFLIRNTRSVHGFWDSLLQQGKKVTGIGGSDTHMLKIPLKRVINHGIPATWVLSREKTAASILEAIRLGRVTLSYDVDIPRVELLADSDGDGVFEAMMGDSVKSSKSQPLEFCVRSVAVIERLLPRECLSTSGSRELAPEILDALRKTQPSTQRVLDLAFRALKRPKAMVALIKDGIVLRTWAQDLSQFSFSFSEPGSSDSSYYRVEVIGRPEEMKLKQVIFSGNTIALTNPIYVNH